MLLSHRRMPPTAPPLKYTPPHGMDTIWGRVFSWRAINPQGIQRTIKDRAARYQEEEKAFEKMEAENITRQKKEKMDQFRKFVKETKEAMAVCIELLAHTQAPPILRRVTNLAFIQRLLSRVRVSISLSVGRSVGLWQSSPNPWRTSAPMAEAPCRPGGAALHPTQGQMGSYSGGPCPH